MKASLSSSTVRIFDKNDIVALHEGVCLRNQSFSFQLYVETDTEAKEAVRVHSDLPIEVYQVHKMKGDLYLDKKNEGKIVDDYYQYAPDDMYPELLRKTEELCLDAGESATLYFHIPAAEKKAGKYVISIEIGDCRQELSLEVLDKGLEESNILLTNWVHIDGICNYYGVAPFTKEFYARFDSYIKKYVEMGNNMLLIPMFTPALDTEVGGERLTTQLVDVVKEGDSYTFDFDKAEYFIRYCMGYGVKYLELSHLYTQWGGEYCPKIIVKENGEDKKLFGWHVPSESEEYQNFLVQYLKALQEFLIKNGWKDKTFIHLTDEPWAEHLEKYARLSKFVHSHFDGCVVLDALSNYEFSKSKAVDMPAVAMVAYDLPQFASVPHMLYYCVGQDGDYATNRYFHLPLQRTEILGFQIFEDGAKGYLHWGYNFYNTRYSLRIINPYEETTAGGEFAAGDSFVVYPGEKEAEPSIRYYALMKAFEDYRLLQTLQSKLGREKVLELLHAEGVKGMHEYPRSAAWQDEFRKKLYQML